MCNAEHHLFYDTDNNTIYMTSKTCRDLLKNSIHFLEYYYDLLSEYMELLLTFGDSCDFEGNYTHHKLPHKYRVKYDKKIHHQV